MISEELHKELLKHIKEKTGADNIIIMLVDKDTNCDTMLGTSDPEFEKSLPLFLYAVAQSIEEQREEGISGVFVA